MYNEVLGAAVAIVVVMAAALIGCIRAFVSSTAVFHPFLLDLDVSCGYCVVFPERRNVISSGKDTLIGVICGGGGGRQECWRRARSSVGERHVQHFVRHC